MHLYHTFHSIFFQIAWAWSAHAYCCKAVLWHQCCIASTMYLNFWVTRVARIYANMSKVGHSEHSYDGNK
jgi:hypothetical protein